LVVESDRISDFTWDGTSTLFCYAMRYTDSGNSAWLRDCDAHFGAHNACVEDNLRDLGGFTRSRFALNNYRLMSIQGVDKLLLYCVDWESILFSHVHSLTARRCSGLR